MEPARRRPLPLLPARACPPSSPLSPGEPHPPPRARLARRHRPAGAGSRAQAALASAKPPPGRGCSALSRPRHPGGRVPTAKHRVRGTARAGLLPRHPADGWAAADARPTANSMDSDSGEQSDGEPVTAGTGGTAGAGRRGSQGRRSRVFLGAAGREADPQQPRSLTGQDWELLRAASLLWGFLSYCTWVRRRARMCVCG